ncbi:hypothetical protein HRbin36_02326 [bacterium HR36]|uniref:Uncharacterized protein n=1 Tax=uncultured Planctomycetota bacterium TaxID=120965 RepID=H5SBY9_9BACT|nr:hypothetical protein HGMM_F07G10C03 [uncultured Planctomycetota bacterium]GBD37196.1 hypothetical protein HRbin36_02326 [bacterium HR36]
MREYFERTWDWVKNRTLDAYDFVREEREKVAIIAVVVILLLFLGGMAFAWWYGSRPDPQLEAMRELREKIDNETDPEKRRELMREYFQGMRNLNEEQRTILWAEMEENNRFNDRLRQLFSLPYEERIKQIDQDIDRMLEMRRKFEEMRQQGFRGPRGGPGGNPGGPGAPGKPNFGGAGPGKPNPGGFGRGPGGGGPGGPQAGPPGAFPGQQRRPLSSEERDRLRRLYLDHTSPEMRAMRSEYRRLMQERMQQRGISFSGGRGFGGPGFGPGFGGPGFGGGPRR